LILPRAPKIVENVVEKITSQLQKLLARKLVGTLVAYCTVYAEIDGVIARRDVNPGDNLQAGQSVMAIRSLRDIWIDANFRRPSSASCGSANM
jgi:multidrug resistance efflux pump